VRRGAVIARPELGHAWLRDTSGHGRRVTDADRGPARRRCPSTPEATTAGPWLLCSTIEHAGGPGPAAPMGDSSSARFPRSASFAATVGPASTPARTTASIRALAQRLQAPDSRLWRVGGLSSPSLIRPAFVPARVFVRGLPSCPAYAAASRAAPTWMRVARSGRLGNSARHPVDDRPGPRAGRAKAR
jgi:hypothetical protein